MMVQIEIPTKPKPYLLTVSGEPKEVERALFGIIDQIGILARVYRVKIHGFIKEG